MPQSERQFVSCHVGKALFGVDVLLVREINRYNEVVYVDLAPKSILGLMNLRGQIVSVMDLSTRLGLTSQDGTESERVIVLKTNRELAELHGDHTDIGATADDVIGMRVDAVGDLVVVPADEVLTAPTNVGEVEGRFLEGVIKLEDGLMAVLRMDQLLQSSHM